MYSNMTNELCYCQTNKSSLINDTHIQNETYIHISMRSSDSCLFVCSDRERDERPVHEGETAWAAREARGGGAAPGPDDAHLLRAAYAHREGAHEPDQSAGAAQPARQTMTPMTALSSRATRPLNTTEAYNCSLLSRRAFWSRPCYAFYVFVFKLSICRIKTNFLNHYVNFSFTITLNLFLISCVLIRLDPLQWNVILHECIELWLMSKNIQYE